MAQSNEGAKTQRRSQEYPEDRFDRVSTSGRVGAHRVTAKPRHFWYYLVAGALAFVLLTCAGVLIVQGSGGKNPLPSATPTQGTEQGVTAELDPNATVAVFNGTEDTNLGGSVGGSITAEGWGQVVFTENLAESNVAISAVFYRDEADEAAARGLAEKLGGVSTYLTEDYAEYDAKLIVLIGADYAGPRAEAAAETGGAAADGAVEETPADPSQTGPNQPAQ